MRFPDEVTITTAASTDEYGNPGESFEGASSSTTPGFFVSSNQPGDLANLLLLLPASAAIAPGARVAGRGKRYRAVEVDEVRSPSKTVLWTVRLMELP